MKKLFLIAFLLLVTVCFVACGENDRTDNEENLIKELRECYVGNTVFMGQYEQSNDRKDGLEPIKWIVIAKEEGKVLLLSQSVLDWKPFNQSDDITKPCSWKTSVVRDFLNGSFYETAFSDFIKSKILPSTITNIIDFDPRNLFSDHNETTTDKVFILSEEEMYKYNLVNRDNGDSSPTNYARGLGANGSYWLRDIGWSSYGVGWFETSYALENTYAQIKSSGQSINLGDRPAVWINIE